MSSSTSSPTGSVTTLLTAATQHLFAQKQQQSQQQQQQFHGNPIGGAAGSASDYIISDNNKTALGSEYEMLRAQKMCKAERTDLSGKSGKPVDAKNVNVPAERMLGDKILHRIDMLQPNKSYTPVIANNRLMYIEDAADLNTAVILLDEITAIDDETPSMIQERLRELGPFDLEKLKEVLGDDIVLQLAAKTPVQYQEFPPAVDKSNSSSSIASTAGSCESLISSFIDEPKL